MSIQISAIICTYNRADYLRKSLQSLAEQTLNSDLYEIAVVDNHSTDNTKQVATEEFAGVSNLRYIYEPILGLSQARNTGWQKAKGEYIAYLDDDAIADSFWLEKILKAFKTVTPQPGCVGGKIELLWEVEKPDWLPPQFFPYLGLINWSNAPMILKDERYISGGNMAVPRSLLEVLGGFNVKLGRKGHNLLSNEELFLLDRMKQQGYSIYYDPEIVIAHHVQASRLTKHWFVKRHYWQGVSDALIAIERESLPMQKRIHLGMIKLKKLFKSPKQFAYLFLSSSNKNRLSVKCDTWKQIGYIWALFTLKDII
ncbi:MAG: glycosyltransferase [Cyanobacteriota bacterium]|nr:glycosyltransferase [Cyanobacteriota bacterium]